MKLRTLRVTATALAALIILTMVAVGCTAKREEPQAETEKVETVQETAPETTTTAQDEKEEEKINDGYRSNSGGINSNRDDADSGTGNDCNNVVEEVKETISAEDLAQMVIDAGINGEARKAELGDRYDEVQHWIDEHYQAPEPETYSYYYDDTEVYYQPDTGYYYSDGALTPDAGVNYYGGVLETYYNLPMEGVVDWMHSLGYGGDYWIRSDGVKMLGDYVMVAADYGWMPKGSIVETSLGTGIVCDTGLGGWYWYDIATNW